MICWRPVIIFAIPCSNTKDDWGDRIPNDSIVYGNIWNMHHDEGHYVGAEEFTPDRYEGRDKTSLEYTRTTEAMERDQYVYGGTNELS